MSDAAVQYVKTYTHPDVTKGSPRRLLEVIAEQIPEGETMTPLLKIKELATFMGYGENAARQGRRTLMAAGVVRIVNGGQGEVSRYELVQLPGARGDDPVLPLIGAAAPPRARRSPLVSGPGLFDAAEREETVNNFDQKDRSWRWYFDPFDRSTRWLVAVLRSFSAMLVRNFDLFDRSTTVAGEGKVENFDPFDRSVPEERQINFDPFDRSTLPLDVDDARTREYVHTSNVHTHTAPPPNEPTTHGNPPPPPCRYAGTVHAWCAGRVHVPTALHREFLAKLGRSPGETNREQEARLLAFYAQTCADLAPDQPIGENDFKFWRRAFAGRFVRAGPIAVESRPDVWGTGCPHTPTCASTRECIDRRLADGRAEQRRRSG